MPGASRAKPSSCASGWHGCGRATQAARLLLTDAEGLHATEHALVAALTAASPEIRAARDLAGMFAGLIKARDAAGLEPWLDAAKGSELRGFADGLRRNLPAVRAALTSP